MSLMDQPPTRTPYSAKKTVKPISFFFAAPKAKSVCLCGDFNDWNATAHPMKRRADGWWFLQVPLTHGHHLYYFVVDGEPTLDPQSAGVVRNQRDEVASLIAVS
jgi:1,4-alpha-glucan branching enzyme